MYNKAKDINVDKRIVINSKLEKSGLNQGRVFMISKFGTKLWTQTAKIHRNIKIAKILSGISKYFKS